LVERGERERPPPVDGFYWLTREARFEKREEAGLAMCMDLASSPGWEVGSSLRLG
jgi:hypothetical protein